MKAKVNLPKKDIVVAAGCVVFVIMNLGAIGTGGRMKAREVLCRSNLRQWGVMFQMYAEDNDGELGDGNWNGDYSIESRGYREWLHYLRPYYKNDHKITLCPMATKPWSRGARGKYSAWGIFASSSQYRCPYDGTNWSAEIEGYYEAVIEGAWQSESPGDVGSYGMNNWCSGMPENKEQIATGYMAGGSRPLAGAWLTFNVKDADTIPLFLDALWLAGSPRQIDIPPQLELGVTQAQGSANNMNRFAVNRHNGNVNSLFLDFSVRPVGLKELWIQKWSRIYTIDSAVRDEYGDLGAIQNMQALGAWPPWMAEFKDYFDINP